MKIKSLISTLAIAVLALGAAGAVQAADHAPFLVKVGVADVVPASDNGTLADGAFTTDVGNSARPSITFEYLITPNIGVELLAAWPFTNDIRLNGDKLAAVDVLPPTLSVQYHFLPETGVSPFIGVGVNYTFMFNEDTKGALSGSSLDLDDSWGVAAHFGVDFNVTKSLVITVDGRWIQMENDVKLDGKGIGTADINPWVWGLSIGYRF